MVFIASVSFILGFSRDFAVYVDKTFLCTTETVKLGIFILFVHT